MLLSFIAMLSHSQSKEGLEPWPSQLPNDEITLFTWQSCQ